MNSLSHSFNVAVFFAVLFLIVSHPLTYKFVHRLLKPLFSVADKAGCATMHGLLLHTLVFGVVVFLISYFFGSSSMEMMTNGPSEAMMADAMGTPAPSDSEMVMDSRRQNDDMTNQMSEDDNNMGYASPDSQMEMPLNAQPTAVKGTLAMGADELEAAPVSTSPVDGDALPMDYQMESKDPVAQESFTGYAPVF